MTESLKDQILALISMGMMLLIIFGLLFVLAGSTSGVNMADPMFLNGLSMIVIAGILMFLRAFLYNKW